MPAPTMPEGFVPLDDSCKPPAMNKPTFSTKTAKRCTENSNDAITASVELVKMIVAVGEMLPVVGGFVKGLGGVATVILTNLGQLEKNKEDVEELAKDITDILIIVRDAVIVISAEPEGIAYSEDLRKACLEFQECLSNLTTQVRDISRSQDGPRKSIKHFLTSRNVKEEINGHRQSMEAARSKLLLSLTLSSNASVSHMKHGITSLRSLQTDLMTVTGGIQRDISHIKSNTRKAVVNNKFHNLLHGDIQIRELLSHRKVAENNSRRTGEIIKFTADVSTSGRIMVVKEYSGSLGLLAWKQQLDIHTQFGRHPNLRQLYGVVEPGHMPSLIFYGTSEFPKLFDKRLEFLAHAVLTHAFHSAFRFSLTHLKVAFGFNDVRCTPDGLLLFDDLQVSPKWDKLYMNNLADLFRPVSPEIQDSLNLFMRRRHEPLVLKKHLLSYYDIIVVGASLHGNVGFPLEHEMLFGKIVISDTLSDSHFVVDSLEDKFPHVRISMITQPEAGNFLELPSGLWRYRLPENIATIDLVCSMSLTSAAKRERFFLWFSQGPRILAQICFESNGSRLQLIISQITQRYFHIHVEAHSNLYRPPSNILYLFIGTPFLRESHKVCVPDVYISSDPHGARLGAVDAWQNHYRYSVADIGHDVLLHRPLSLECSTLFHKICGFHPMSLKIARCLNQSELGLHLIQDEAISTEISRGISGCSSMLQMASIVPLEQLKVYSDMLEDLNTSEPENRNHDPLRGEIYVDDFHCFSVFNTSQSEAQIYEVKSDEIINPGTSEGVLIQDTPNLPVGASFGLVNGWRPDTRISRYRTDLPSFSWCLYSWRHRDGAHRFAVCSGRPIHHDFSLFLGVPRLQFLIRST
ncbi:hypothetical protein DFS33DRAFT_882406 [Desarmillaria ectypa]|nr:hypothetical protein DFS33DRAFT_882406 [Desarmillaria ectypa]